MNLEIRYSPPNQPPQVVPVRDRLMIGSLLSNEVVIRAPGVEPIHAMIELLDNGSAVLTDLGSQSGVHLNGTRLDVEAPIKVGDRFTIAQITIEVHPYTSAVSQFRTAVADGTRASGEMTVMQGQRAATIPESEVGPASEHDDDEEDERPRYRADDPTQTVRMEAPSGDRGSDGADMLFSPRHAKPGGNVLEVVSYWDDTILDVDLFHRRIKGFERVSIGTPPKAHFLAGGSSDIDFHELARPSEEGYSLNLLPDMTARLRRGGKVSEEKGGKSISMSKHDIAHITHGAVKYFLMFVKPPVLDLPRSSARDPVFAFIMFASILFYIAAVPAIYLSKDPNDKKDEDDIWSIVNTPEKKEMPKPIPKPKVEVAEVKKEPPPKPTPPKPPPKPPTPVQPEVKPKPVEQPKQTKPTPPVEKPTEQLAEKPVEKPQPVQKPPTPQPKEDSKQGMVATGTKPDFKAPGQKTDGKVGPSGGAAGGDKMRPAAGGQRKGDQKVDLAGAEGGAPNKASGVNLGKLGLGAGKVLSTVGAGAIKTDFKDSAGGAGGGAGSGAKTYGLGGPGTGATLGVSGTGGAVNNFGGFGGNGSGQGGSGGLGGAGLGKSFGRGGAGRANVSVPEGDPVVSGGLTTQEVQAVIRANLNQIRHCYEQLLQRSPNANGKIKVAFTIGADGRVASSNIQSDTIGDAVMAGCVSGHVSRWKFPNPRGGVSVNVNYPFVFNPL